MSRVCCRQRPRRRRKGCLGVVETDVTSGGGAGRMRMVTCRDPRGTDRRLLHSGRDDRRQTPMVTDGGDCRRSLRSARSMSSSLWRMG